MAILNTSLQSTPTAISPALASDSAVIVMFFCNTNPIDPFDPTNGKQHIDVYVVKNGEQPGSTNIIAHQIPIDASDTFTFNAERLVLNPGDQIYASATDNDQISATTSYVII